MKFTFAPEATPLAGYTIKRAIDRGGFGEVYYALADSGKEVALKLLQRNQQVELRGVTQCLNLKHPNLVTIFDIRTDAEGDNWVVMEFVSGKSLEQVLDEHPQGLPLSEVELWLAGMAAGVGFLHDRGIVHRDLKPANVFREGGVVKIGDVGLSKFITPSRRSAQTESVGTVYYMAPEVARGKYGSELDVYSLGVMLYEMLTGHVPFNGESTGEILMKHLTEPPDLSKIAAPFRPVLARALEKDPQQRTPGALQLLDDFRRAMAGKPLAVEIPDSHFVDIPRLERDGRLRPPAPLGGRQPLPVAAATTSFPAGPNNGRALPPLPVIQPGQSRRNGHGASAWNKFGDEIRRNPWLGVALVIGALFVLPGVARGIPFFGFRGWAWGEMLALAAVSFVTFKVITHFVGQAHPSAPVARPAASPPVPPSPQFGAVASPAVAIPVRQAAAPAPRPPATKKPNPAQFSPDTPRSIPFRQRVGGLSASLALAAVWGLIWTGVAGFVSGYWPILGIIGPGHTPAFADPGRAGLFALTTILGAWAIILPTRLWEGTGADTARRRLVMTALGAAVGACGFWLDQTLLVDLPYENAFPGIVKSMGAIPLMTDSRQPTLAGYVVFFAALFGLRRWWWQADAFRAKRFRITSLVLTGLVAFFIPAAFVFPQVWGICWAVAMAAVVQLSSPWVPIQERLAHVENQGAAVA